MFYSERPILGITGCLIDVSLTPGLKFGYLRIRFSDKWQEIAINGIALKKEIAGEKQESDYKEFADYKPNSSRIAS